MHCKIFPLCPLILSPQARTGFQYDKNFDIFDGLVSGSPKHMQINQMIHSPMTVGILSNPAAWLWFILFCASSMVTQSGFKKRCCQCIHACTILAPAAPDHRADVFLPSFGEKGNIVPLPYAGSGVTKDLSEVTSGGNDKAWCFPNPSSLLFIAGPDFLFSNCLPNLAARALMMYG